MHGTLWMRKTKEIFSILLRIQKSSRREMDLEIIVRWPNGHQAREAQQGLQKKCHGVIGSELSRGGGNLS